METILNICLAVIMACLALLVFCFTLSLAWGYFVLPAYKYITKRSRSAKNQINTVRDRMAYRFTTIWPIVLDIDLADRIVLGSAKVDKLDMPDKDRYGRLVISMTVKKSEEE